MTWIRSIPHNHIRYLQLRILVCFCLLITQLPAVSVARKAFTVDEIRAVYLYNFLKYVTWPEKTSDGYQICSIGKVKVDPYKALATRNINGDSIEYKKITNIDDASGCNILFLGFVSDENILKGFVDTVNDKPILTVSSAEGFTDMGGMIQIIISKQEKILKINVDKAHAAGLTISSNLLDIAQIVSAEPLSLRSE